MGKNTDFPVMLAHSYDPDRIKDWRRAVVEPKLDGIRVIVLVDLKHDGIHFYSRNGRELDMFGHLHSEIEKFANACAKYDKDCRDGVMIDGEMVSKTGKFADIGGAIHRKDHTAVYARLLCFHAMPLECFEAHEDTAPQYKRARMVRAVIKARKLKLLLPCASSRVACHSDVLAMHAANRTAGHEGSMIKDHSKPWIAKRSRAWMKIKDELSIDVVVTGMVRGKGKYAKTLGKLTADCEGAKLKFSGMTDKQRRRWWRHPDEIVGKMVEVSYQEKTEAGKLRHIRFVRTREDKQEIAA